MITYYHVYGGNHKTGKSWDIANFTNLKDAENYLEAYCEGMGYDVIHHPDEYVYGELKSKRIQINITTATIFESFDESIKALQQDLD